MLDSTYMAGPMGNSTWPWIGKKNMADGNNSYQYQLETCW